jgi:hypothetical protein
MSIHFRSIPLSALVEVTLVREGDRDAERLLPFAGSLFVALSDHKAPPFPIERLTMGAGFILGLLIASVGWAGSGSFLWYSWAFCILVLSLAGLGIGALVRDAAWFRKTPLYRQWTGIAGERIGRIAVAVFLAFFGASGVVVGLVPLMVPQSKPTANENDPAYYAYLLEEMRSGDAGRLAEAVRQFDGYRIPAVDVAEIRLELLKIAADEKADFITRCDAARGVGVIGNGQDIAALERIRTEAEKLDDKMLASKCGDAIDRLRSK